VTAAAHPAVARAEWILASAVAVLRLGALLLVAMTVVGAGAKPVTVSLASILVLESTAFVAVVLRSGRVPRTAAVLDVLVVATVIWLSSGPPLPPGSTGESVFVSFALMVATGGGLVDWPWWIGVATSTVLVVSLVAPLAFSAGLSHPLWTVLLDGSAAVLASLIAVLVARLVRGWGREYDRHRRLIVQRAEVLARERERTRQGEALRQRLVGTLEDVVAAGVVTDRTLADQVGREVRWLRRFAEVGLADSPPDLATGLRQLAAEKSATGLRVLLDLPDRMPDRTSGERHALLEATREALTNVGKHAGVTVAAVGVRVEPGGLLVEISDSGRGYDQALARTGRGQTSSIQQRLAEVGGVATVESLPGHGTRVILRLPALAP
jgi:signal transduction histidine kinase